MLLWEPCILCTVHCICLACLAAMWVRNWQEGTLAAFCGIIKITGRILSYVLNLEFHHSACHSISLLICTWKLLLGMKAVWKFSKSHFNGLFKTMLLLALENIHMALDVNTVSVNGRQWKRCKQNMLKSKMNQNLFHAWNWSRKPCCAHLLRCYILVSWYIICVLWCKVCCTDCIRVFERSAGIKLCIECVQPCLINPS